MHALGFLVLALGLLGGRAAAQTPLATPPSGTTVSGVTVTSPAKPAPSERQRIDQSLNFIGSRGQTAHLGQLARWPEPVCPVSFGLSPPMNQLVADRVARLAFEVGAPQARRRGRCRPNVEILFTDQPQALMDLVAKKRNKLLGYHFVADERAVTRIVRPVQAWYLTQTVAGGGAAANVGVPASTASAQSLDLVDNHTPGGCAGSAFTECLSSQFVNILIVADANDLSGRPLGPVADYIALIAIAQFKTLETCDSAPTLLDMFTPACAGRSIADAPAKQDIGYLKALYAGPSSLRLWLQKNEIAFRMAHTPAPSH